MLPADKGYATAVLDTADYVAKVKNLPKIKDLVEQTEHLVKIEAVSLGRSRKYN